MSKRIHVLWWQTMSNPHPIGRGTTPTRSPASPIKDPLPVGRVPPPLFGAPPLATPPYVFTLHLQGKYSKEMG